MSEQEKTGNTENEYGDVIKAVRSTLISSHKELGRMKCANVENWMKFRRDIFFVTITLLVAVTPFANDKYVHCVLLFLVGYALLFISGLTGLITEEIGLRTLNSIWQHGETHLKESIEKLFGASTKDQLLASLEIFKKAGSVPKKLESRLQFTEKLSTIAFWSFIISLVLIVISIMPFISNIK